KSQTVNVADSRRSQSFTNSGWTPDACNWDLVCTVGGGLSSAWARVTAAKTTIVPTSGGRETFVNLQPWIIRSSLRRAPKPSSSAEAFEFASSGFHCGQVALGSKLRIDTLATLGICGRRNGFSHAV